MKSTEGPLNRVTAMVPSIVDLYHKGISTAGMSKVFSLAGLRVGWVVAPKELTENILIHRGLRHYIGGHDQRSLRRLGAGKCRPTTGAKSAHYARKSGRTGHLDSK